MNGRASRSWGKNAATKLDEIVILQTSAKRVFFIPDGGISKLGGEYVVEERNTDKNERHMRPDLASVDHFGKMFGW